MFKLRNAQFSIWESKMNDDLDADWKLKRRVWLYNRAINVSWKNKCNTCLNFMIYIATITYVDCYESNN